MAAVRKLPNGRFQGVARHPSGRRSTKVFPLKRMALAWAEEIEAGWRHGSIRDPRAGRITVGQWYALWLPARTIAETTAERQKRVHDKLVLPHWRAWPLESITRIEVRSWIAGMTKSGISPAEVHLAFYALSKMLRDAADENPPLIVANPCVRIPLPPLPTASERFFTHAEIDAVLAKMNEPWRTMAELAVWTGLRWEELAGLHGNSVQWMRGTLKVANVATKFGDRPHPKSEASRRTVPVPQHVIEAMSRLMVGRPPGGRVFEHRGRAPKYSTWHFAFRKACADAGVEYAPPHTLRHTAASWLAQAGVDQYRIAALLGHGSTRITARYSHLAPDAHDRIKEAWATVGAEFERRLSAEEGTQ